jgi:hypothetical protein
MSHNVTFVRAAKPTKRKDLTPGGKPIKGGAVYMKNR